MLSLNLKKISIAAVLVSLSLNSSILISYAAKQYPGVFISDTQNRWHSDYEYSSEESFGYVICDGGYIGSPLIPNDRKTVDKFLNYCRTGEKVGPGRLPIINASTDPVEKSTVYSAYKAELNGETYYLCRGYLNSTPNCSKESDAQAEKLISQIKNTQLQNTTTQENNNSEEKEITKNIQRIQVQEVNDFRFSEDKSQKLDPLKNRSIETSSRDPLVRRERKLSTIIEAANNNSYDIKGTSLEGVKIPGIDLEGARVIPLTSTKKSISSEAATGQNAIKISLEDLEALKTGRISLTELVHGFGSEPANKLETNTVSTNVQTIPLNKVLLKQKDNSQRNQAIKLTKEELDDLQNGRISLEKLTAGKQIISLNNPQNPSNSILNNSTSAPLELNSGGKQAIQVTAEELQALKSGQLSITDLQNRPIVNLNEQGQFVNKPISPNNNSVVSQPQPSIKAVPITQETLTALQSGRVSLQEVLSSKQTINISNQAVNFQEKQINQPYNTALLSPNINGPTILEQVQNTQPQQAELTNNYANSPALQQMPGQVSPQLDNYQQQALQNTQQIPIQGMVQPQLQYGAFVPGNPIQNFEQNPPGQSIGMQPNFYPQSIGEYPPAQYGIPAVSPMLQAYNNSFNQQNYNQLPYDFSYNQMGAAPLGNPDMANYSSNVPLMGPPVSYVTTPVYGTHTNAKYFPGAIFN
ncbi:MAG: hypothetical protein QNJ31_05180 [Candidatus Caenarcaniphilales bacterium]|nr:hypothetical protein [Candidatus Caenarcaniphilales bacterium]